MTEEHIKDTNMESEISSIELPEKYVSVKVIAELFDIGVGTIKDWIKHEGFPHYKVSGNTVRFLPSEAVEWFKNRAESYKKSTES